MLCKEKTYPFTKEGYELMMQDMESRNILIEFEKVDFSNPKIQRVFFCASLILALLMISNPVLASTVAANPFDKIGFKFLGYARAAGYWICLIKAIMVIVKSAMEEDIMGCWKKVVGYIIAFGSLYFLPQLFDAVKF